MIEDVEWVRRSKQSPIGSQTGRRSGWELWRRRAQPFPHGEIAAGFRYLICDRPPGGTLDDEEIVTTATVERYMKFAPVSDLEHAHQVAVRYFGPADVDPLDEWLDNPYNRAAVEQGKFDPPGGCQLAMWTFVGETIDPVDVGPFEPSRHRTGWKRLA
jgi:hypothetical protein